MGMELKFEQKLATMTMGLTWDLVKIWAAKWE
jgi:hypothetical protein